MSTLFVNNLNTASGSTITVPTGKKLIVTDSAGLIAPDMVIQCVTANGSQTNNSSASSWVTLTNPKYLSPSLGALITPSTVSPVLNENFFILLGLTYISSGPGK